MEFDPHQGERWLDEVSIALPGLAGVLERSKADVLVIGASVFHLFSRQGWIPALKRQTADLDLSVGIVHGREDYEALRDGLLREGYRNEGLKYRYYSPRKLPGNLNYVDLLAHPIGRAVHPEQARNIMGAGPDFSFAGMEFAMLEAHSVTARLHCPNPIGFIHLKRVAYLDDPMGRLKDLADIVELGTGLVEKGSHFGIAPLWKKLSGSSEAQDVRKLFLELGESRSSTWDLEDVRQELFKRGFTVQEIEEVIPERLLDLARSMGA